MIDDEDSSETPLEELPLPIPKRIARRRDTFCELIDSPDATSTGQKPIRMRIINRIISDDSDDEDDRMSIDKTKETIENMQSRECQIVLNRNEVKEIIAAQKRKAETAFSDETDYIEPSESASWQEGSETGSSSSYDQQAKRFKVLPNTDRDVHCKTKINDCCLCGKKSIRNIIIHYVNEHDRQEVLCARMTPETTDRLRKEGGCVANMKPLTKGYEISAFCPYCEETRSSKQPKDWIEHITRHTGEFMRYCKHCGAKFAGKANSGPNCPHSATGTSKPIEMPGLHLRVLVCKFCNFSQLRKKNIETHLRKMHKIDPTEFKDNYESIDIIKNFRKKKSTVQVEESEDEDDSSDESSSLNRELIVPAPSNAALQSDVFHSSEQDDIDTDTFRFMKETTFAGDKSSKPQKPRTSMIDRLSERFRKQDETKNSTKSMASTSQDLMSVETVPNEQVASAVISEEVVAEEENSVDNTNVAQTSNHNNDNSEDDEKWESCTGSDDSDDDNENAHESNEVTKNKSIQNTLLRLTSSIIKNRQTKTKKSKKLPKNLIQENNVIEYENENLSVQTIGINVINRKILYLCFERNCNYEVDDLREFLLHIHEHSELKWGGRCVACGKKVQDADTTVLDEFNHLHSVHLKKYKITLPSLDDDNDRPISPPTIENIPQNNEITVEKISTNIEIVSSNGKARALIKCRRVSGDILSATKDANASTPILQESPKLKIDNQNDEIKNPLKPWTDCPFKKYQQNIKQMLRDVSLIALYKCMAIDCIFTTGDPLVMLDHLHNHEEGVSNAMKSTDQTKLFDHVSWLECSYCDNLEQESRCLVKHIQSVHSTSIYQCSYCFYRTVDAANVELHQKIYHNKKEPLIMVGMGQTKQLHTQIDAMLMGKEKFVQPIRCGDEGNSTRI